MPIEYNISPDGLLIETRPSGVLDAEETVEYFKKLKNDNRLKPGACEIVDFQDVTEFRISNVESRHITELYQGAKSSRLISQTIFVCTSDLAYGIGRMLQSYHNMSNPDHLVTVVRSENELNETYGNKKLTRS